MRSKTKANWRREGEEGIKKCKSEKNEWILTNYAKDVPWWINVGKVFVFKTNKTLLHGRVEFMFKVTWNIVQMY